MDKIRKLIRKLAVEAAMGGNPGFGDYLIVALLFIALVLVIACMTALAIVSHGVILLVIGSVFGLSKLFQWLGNGA